MFNIIRLFVIFLLIYFLFNLFKTTIIVKRNMDDLRRQTRKGERREGRSMKSRDQVIELDHDQYKVE